MPKSVPDSYNSSFLKGQLRALANHYGGVVADHLNAAAERLDELERDLGLERESHEVTKRMYDDAASSSGPESEWNAAIEKAADICGSFADYCRVISDRGAIELCEEIAEDIKALKRPSPFATEEKP
jgi:hypothetical protein